MLSQNKRFRKMLLETIYPIVESVVVAPTKTIQQSPQTWNNLTNMMKEIAPSLIDTIPNCRGNCILILRTFQTSISIFENQNSIAVIVKIKSFANF